MSGTTGTIGLALALALSACGGSDPAPIEPSASQDEAGIDAVVGEAFTLRIGETAAIAGTNLTIRFVAVPADSRCPTDVQCVWSGNARVEIRAGGVVVALNTHEQPRATRIGEYQLALASLAPAPKSTESIAPGRYAATLIVTRPGR